MIVSLLPYDSGLSQSDLLAHDELLHPPLHEDELSQRFPHDELRHDEYLPYLLRFSSLSAFRLYDAGVPFIGMAGALASTVRWAITSKMPVSQALQIRNFVPRTYSPHIWRKSVRKPCGNGPCGSQLFCP